MATYIVTQGIQGPEGAAGATGPAGPPGTSSLGDGGSFNASVVLYCPTLTTEDLTPTDGDTMYWVEHTPDLDAPDPMTGLWNWRGREEFVWTEGWATANDPTNVLILTPEGDWLPVVLAEVVPGGFVAIEVLGGQPVLLGCGGSVDFAASTWFGWNVGDGTQGGGIDPTLPATFIAPTGTQDEWVQVVDRTGNGAHRTLADWIKRNERKYYEDSVAVQPWVQTDADFGVSSTVTAHGHVTRTATWVADATITFRSDVEVVTPGTGVPQFFIHEIFRSLDPEFSGWQWGWSNPSNLRCSVHGQIGGLDFVGFVRRGGNILDADGNPLVRVLQTGDYLIGTVTGVFQND